MSSMKKQKSFWDMRSLIDSTVFELVHRWFESKKLEVHRTVALRSRTRSPKRPVPWFFLSCTMGTSIVEMLKLQAMLKLLKHIIKTGVQHGKRYVLMHSTLVHLLLMHTNLWHELRQPEISRASHSCMKSDWANWEKATYVEKGMLDRQICSWLREYVGNN